MADWDECNVGEQVVEMVEDVAGEGGVAGVGAAGVDVVMGFAGVDVVVVVGVVVEEGEAVEGDAVVEEDGAVVGVAEAVDAQPDGVGHCDVAVEVGDAPPDVGNGWSGGCGAEACKGFVEQGAEDVAD